MNKHIEQPLNKYLDALAAKIPSPGGGSAAALVASTGVSLLCMVANFTIGKKGYEEHQPEIKSILAKLESNRLKLNELIDKDTYVYEKVSVAYKLAKNTDEKKTQRELSIQAALKEAISVPFEIIEISINSIPEAHKLVKMGNRNLISDISCGMFFLKSAIEAARDNVTINLNSVSDKSFVNKKKDATESSINNIFPEIDKIINSVNAILNT